jgi:hypothetical protein
MPEGATLRTAHVHEARTRLSRIFATPSRPRDRPLIAIALEDGMPPVTKALAVAPHRVPTLW